MNDPHADCECHYLNDHRNREADMKPVEKGDRVRLVRTDDPWTQLQPGALGTVTDVRWDDHGLRVHMRWDNGSTLTMLPDEGDMIEKVEEATR